MLSTEPGAGQVGTFQRSGIHLYRCLRGLCCCPFLRLRSRFRLAWRCLGLFFRHDLCFSSASILSSFLQHDCRNGTDKQPLWLCATLVLTAAAEQRWRYGMSGGAVKWSFRVRKGQCLVHVFSNLIVRAFYGPIEARHQLSMQQSRTLLTLAQHPGATAFAGPFSPCA
jgi:hypothetical protein